MVSSPTSPPNIWSLEGRKSTRESTGAKPKKKAQALSLGGAASTQSEAAKGANRSDMDALEDQLEEEWNED